jgi:hypothetical protein
MNLSMSELQRIQQFSPASVLLGEGVVFIVDIIERFGKPGLDKVEG